MQKPCRGSDAADGALRRVEERRATRHAVPASRPRSADRRADGIDEPAASRPAGAGYCYPQGTPQTEQHLATIVDGEDVRLSPRMRSLIGDMRAEWGELDRRIETFDDAVRVAYIFSPTTRSTMVGACSRSP